MHWLGVTWFVLALLWIFCIFMVHVHWDIQQRRKEAAERGAENETTLIDLDIKEPREDQERRSLSPQ